MSFLQNVSEIYATEYVSIYRFESSSKRVVKCFVFKNGNHDGHKKEDHTDETSISHVMSRRSCHDEKDPHLHQNP